MSTFRPTTRPTPVPAPYGGPGDRSANRASPPEPPPAAPFVPRAGREWARTPVWDVAVAIPTPPQLTIVSLSPPGTQGSAGDGASDDGAAGNSVAGDGASDPAGAAPRMAGVPGGAWRVEERGAEAGWVAERLEEVAARVRSGAVVVRELAPDAGDADVLAAALRAIRPFAGA